jgi:hypothetical protein
MAIDDTRCPICGGDNECAMAKGEPASRCWCQDAEISDELMERVPEEARGKACICPRCTGGSGDPAGA